MRWPSLDRCGKHPFDEGAQVDMRTTAVRSIRITHRSSGEVIAEGPLGFWGITPFEGNLYIRRKYLRTSHLRPNWVPGLCIYKFLYVWLDLRLPNGTSEPFVGWMYWLPNPLLPFIAFRPAVLACPQRYRSKRSSVKTNGNRGSLQWLLAP